jgi:chromosome segregation ATPase
MVKGGKGGAKRGAPASRAPAPAHNDADETMEDARAEIADTNAELDAGTSAGESSGAPARALPPALLQRRLDKAKSDAESAIKEKEAMHKQMDEMRAELELAKSNVGDYVQVAHDPVSTPARKVCLVPLETG